MQFTKVENSFMLSKENNKTKAKVCIHIFIYNYISKLK